MPESFVAWSARLRALIAAPMAAILFFSPTAPAEPPTARALGLYVENDARTVGGPGSDQAYSNGLRLSYVHARGEVPAWAEPLAAHSEAFQREREKARVNFGWGLAHQLYTPEQKYLAELIADDRPYAAWLSLGLAVNLRTPSHGHFVELSVGVVGPAAGGEAVQNEFHRVIERRFANGWAHQLRNEPTLQLGYQQRLKFLESGTHDGKTFDVIPFYGGALGNALTAAHLGGLMRVGVNIPDDLGPTRPSSSDGDSFLAPEVSALNAEGVRRWSIYAFAGGRATLTARNIFLDGNSFQDSHRVTKYPLTAETEIGVGLQRHPFSLIWRFVTRSPEFEERGRFNSFGSVSAAVTF